MPRAKGNRTDLNAAPPLPDVTAPGQQYGRATDQREAMRAVPMGGEPVISARPTPGAAAARPSAAPPPQVRPGELPFLDPSEDRSIPITSGLDSGPGPGSEALGPPRNHLSAILGQLSNDPRAGAGVFEAAAAARALGV